MNFTPCAPGRLIETSAFKMQCDKIDLHGFPAAFPSTSNANMDYNVEWKYPFGIVFIFAGK